MEKELLTLLEKLSTQLGQSAEATWNMLIAQARIAAILNFIIGGVLILASLFLIGFGFYNIKKDENDSAAACFIFVVIFFLISLPFIIPAITAAYNPSYWALDKLINMIQR